MNKKNAELVTIIEKFANSGWDLIDGPSRRWLAADASEAAAQELVSAIEAADSECGSCGCEFDALYKRALELLKAA